MERPGSSSALRGIMLDRRSALSMAAGLGSMLAVLSIPATLGLVGCTSPGKSHEDHNALVLTLLSIVIPDTRTPGAGNQANSEFILRAVDAGLMGVSDDTLDLLAADLDHRAGTLFLNLPPPRRERILADLDDEVFASGTTRPAPWMTVKALILMSYYTSETGASQELHYELVPGRFDPDIIIDRDWRPLSNDWAGNAIRKKIAG